MADGTAGRPVAPHRRGAVLTPVAIATVEWGDGGPAGQASRENLFLVHGGGDFARTFDTFAPLLGAEGHRVVAWDQRGHGDSARAALYAWSAELRDAAAVLEAYPGGPHVLVGHSKGGVLAIELTLARPDLVKAVVAIDGFIRRAQPPGATAAPPPEQAARWLDARRRARPARTGSAAELALRRAALNPRLEPDWLDHLVDVGATAVNGDQRAWKVDPSAYPPAPQPWSMAESLDRLRDVRRPLLVLKAGVEEAIAGQPSLADLTAHLPRHASLRILDGLGHFAHVEDPHRVAALVLEFLRAVDTGALPPWQLAT